MLTLMIGGRRRAGMTHRDYSRHLQVIHGGLVREGPGELACYLQNHVFDAAYGTRDAGWRAGPDFDSIAELSFADGAALARSLAEPHYRNAIQPDETNFVTHDAIILLATMREEQPVSRPANGRLKAMRFLAARDGTDAAVLARAWRAENARLVGHPMLRDVVRRMTRSISLTAERDLPAGFVNNAPLSGYAGVESVWFDASDDLSGLATYRAAIEDTASPLRPLLDRRAEILFVVEERPILP